MSAFLHSTDHAVAQDRLVRDWSVQNRSVVEVFFASPGADNLAASRLLTGLIARGEELDGGVGADATHQNPIRATESDWVSPVGEENDPVSARKRAQRLVGSGRADEAIPVLVAALKRSPGDAALLIDLGEILTARNDSAGLERALAVWGAAASASISGSEPWFHAKEGGIRVYVKLGNLTQAKKMAELLELGYPGFGSPERKERLESLLRKK